MPIPSHQSLLHSPASGPINPVQNPPGLGTTFRRKPTCLSPQSARLTSHAHPHSSTCVSCPCLSSHTSGSLLRPDCLPGTLPPGSPWKAQVLPLPGSLLSLHRVVGPPRLCHLHGGSPLPAQIILCYSNLCTHLPPLPGKVLAPQCPRTEPRAQYLAETPSWDKAEGRFLLSVPGRWQRPL